MTFERLRRNVLSNSLWLSLSHLVPFWLSVDFSWCPFWCGIGPKTCFLFEIEVLIGFRSSSVRWFSSAISYDNFFSSVELLLPSLTASISLNNELDSAECYFRGIGRGHQKLTNLKGNQSLTFWSKDTFANMEMSKLKRWQEVGPKFGQSHSWACPELVIISNTFWFERFSSERCLIPGDSSGKVVWYCVSYRMQLCS